MTDQASPILIGVPRETYPGERRVAMVPDMMTPLVKKGCKIFVESGAGLAAGITDDHYTAKGAEIVGSRDEIFSKCDVIFQVRTYGANPDAGKDDLARYRDGQLVIGFTESLGEPQYSKDCAERKIKLFSLELLPRITRAQSMDVLSSMATVAGYKAVLMAADCLPRFFPMFMTAAGTISPAHVFVVGAGVAGLQAIATAKRLGAVVSAYDVRPAVKEQVESLGGKFVEMEVDAGDAEDKGGYAKEMDEEFYRKQREMMKRVVAENDITITTAAIPGKKSPVLVTSEMVEGMRPGSVIVDLAAERGGNCELTKAGETIDVNGVTIMGPLNLATTIPYHASQMYSKNISTFLLNMIKDGAVTFDMEDEIVRDTMVTSDGDIVSTRIREMLGMSPLGTT